jgi:hypothetical protein
MSPLRPRSTTARRTRWRGLTESWLKAPMPPCVPTPTVLLKMEVKNVVAVKVVLLNMEVGCVIENGGKGCSSGNGCSITIFKHTEVCFF